jgi:hypothetical protein
MPSLCPDARDPSSVLIAGAQQTVDSGHAGVTFHLRIMLQLVAEAL